MKDNTTKSVNPFAFEDAAPTENKTRKLDLTPQLIALSNQRALDLMHSVKDQPELFEAANKAITDCIPEDLINLINTVFDETAIKTDSEFLDGTTDDIFGRLLESRRSDRSKAKKKCPKQNMSVCLNYIAAMYAEMLIRISWKKPYNPTNSTESNDTELAADRDALERRIKSLQSKKCRLAKTAPYVATDAVELEETEAEISRLSQLRPTTGIKTTTIFKGMNLKAIQEAIASIDPETLDPEAKAKFLDLKQKLG